MVSVKFVQNPSPQPNLIHILLLFWKSASARRAFVCSMMFIAMRTVLQFYALCQLTFFPSFFFSVSLPLKIQRLVCTQINSPKMGNRQGKQKASSGGEEKTTTTTTNDAIRSVTTSEDVGLPLLLKEGPFFEKTTKNLHGFSKGSDIGPSLDSYGSTYENQFAFSYLNPATSKYEVLRVESYLASGGFAHVFMAKQVLADGGLGMSFAVKLMYKAGDTELDRLDKREVSCAVGICFLCHVTTSDGRPFSFSLVLFFSLSILASVALTSTHHTPRTIQHRCKAPPGQPAHNTPM